MRFALILVVAVLGLAGCQSAQQAGQPGSCNQVGSTVGGAVICPE